MQSSKVSWLIIHDLKSLPFDYTLLCRHCWQTHHILGTIFSGKTRKFSYFKYFASLVSFGRFKLTVPSENKLSFTICMYKVHESLYFVFSPLYIFLTNLCCHILVYTKLICRNILSQSQTLSNCMLPQNPYLLNN